VRIVGKVRVLVWFNGPILVRTVVAFLFWWEDCGRMSKLDASVLSSGVLWLVFAWMVGLGRANCEKIGFSPSFGVLLYPCSFVT
jgi:hypothetical protein